MAEKSTLLSNLRKLGEQAPPPPPREAAAPPPARQPYSGAKKAGGGRFQVKVTAKAGTDVDVGALNATAAGHVARGKVMEYANGIAQMNNFSQEELSQIREHAEAALAANPQSALAMFEDAYAGELQFHDFHAWRKRFVLGEAPGQESSQPAAARPSYPRRNFSR